MKYNHDNVRRQDRLLAEDEARELLRTGEYGVLSMISGTEGKARECHVDGLLQQK